MKTTKARRESGRSYNKFYDPENGFYNETYWDDWNDHRDGMRERYGNDRTRLIRVDESSKKQTPEPYTFRSYLTGKLISSVDDGFQKIHKNNTKLKKQISIRKARQRPKIVLM
jgi:hypothetical protein